MVCAWQPHGFLALKTRAAHQDILNRVVEDMPDCQHTGNIGRGNYDAIGLPVLDGAGAKGTGIKPGLIPSGLDLSRIVGFGDLSHVYS